MPWADIYWIFGDDKRAADVDGNDITKELTDLEVEPKLESLWWTSTYKAEYGVTLEVVSRRKLERCHSLRSSIF